MAVSFSGLDLSFMKTKESQDALRKMKQEAQGRRRKPVKGKRSHLAAPLVMSDIAPFVSPVGEKPEVISSRSALRRHEREHGVYQCGDIPKGEIVRKNEEKRAKLIEQSQGMTSEWV